MAVVTTPRKQRKHHHHHLQKDRSSELQDKSKKPNDIYVTRILQRKAVRGCKNLKKYP